MKNNNLKTTKSVAQELEEKYQRAKELQDLGQLEEAEKLYKEIINYAVSEEEDSEKEEDKINKQESHSGLFYCGIIGIILTTIGFGVCWWLGFIGMTLGFIALFDDDKTIGTFAIIESIIEIILSLIVLGKLGWL